MGLLDLFRVGKVLLGTARAVRRQRQSAVDLRALPPADFVAACIEALNAPAAPWRGAARPPAAEVDAHAAQLGLPDELREFYRVCDGFGSDSAEFPCPVYRLGELRDGAHFEPALSARVTRYWSEHGNDADTPGMLAVLPPDNLTALVTANAESHLPPAALDAITVLFPPGDSEFTVLALHRLSEQLPAGSVLDIEAGGATRYDGFRHWLASRASLFSSL